MIIFLRGHGERGLVVIFLFIVPVVVPVASPVSRHSFQVFPGVHVHTRHARYIPHGSHELLHLYLLVTQLHKLLNWFAALGNGGRRICAHVTQISAQQVLQFSSLHVPLVQRLREVSVGVPNNLFARFGDGATLLLALAGLIMLHQLNFFTILEHVQVSYPFPSRFFWITNLFYFLKDIDLFNLHSLRQIVTHAFNFAVQILRNFFANRASNIFDITLYSL
mmetsp:Transcript_21398/g.29716  ORF Transcript_21398/g.29716 Transcript_21398/m.29716 type:complete len:221 (-) Transcript_21398:172-834(-)